MAKLETYHIEEFPGKALLESHDCRTDILYMYDDNTNQGAFEIFDVSVYDDAMKRAARIGGRAVFAAAQFNGYVNTGSGEGEITVRHRA